MLPDEIERVALLGWRVYPCSRYCKAGCIKNGTDVATTDLDQLASWSREFPKCNWRVVMAGSGVWALDCDVPPLHADDGVKALAELVKLHGPLPPRPTMRSGSGGVVVFFRHNGEPIVGESGHPAPGIDPRRGRQSQTIPPSLHITTKCAYRWVSPPWEITPPLAPAWLLKAVAPPPEPKFERIAIASTDIARRRLYRAAEAVMRAGHGERNNVLNRRSYQAGAMVASGMLGEQEAIDALYGAARQAGLDHAEAKATIRSGLLAGFRNPAEVSRG